MPDRDMTTDKPGAVAIQAATVLTENLKRYINPAFLTDASVAEMAAIIQAAINEATAAVVAERDEANKDADTACEWQSRLTTQRDEARATIKRNLEISTATEALLRETAEERDEARAERDRWCQEADARTSTLTNVRRQRKEVDAIVLMLIGQGEAISDFETVAAAFQRETGKMRPGKDAPVPELASTSAEFNDWIEQKKQLVRAALTKHAALLAEPEGGG